MAHIKSASRWLRHWVAFAWIALIALPVSADTLAGEVVGIADGDTITVVDADRHQHRIRLSGIDAPERKQAFGTKSREALSALVFRRAVLVEYRKHDRYGRLVGKVLINGADVGLAQIEAGLAWHYLAYAKEQSDDDRHAYASAEARARIAKRGLWGDAQSPVPPWSFRHQRGAGFPLTER